MTSFPDDDDDFPVRDNFSGIASKRPRQEDSGIINFSLWIILCIMYYKFQFMECAGIIVTVIHS